MGLYCTNTYRTNPFYKKTPGFKRKYKEHTQEVSYLLHLRHPPPPVASPREANMMRGSSKAWNLPQEQTPPNHLDDVLRTLNGHRHCRSGDDKGKRGTRSATVELEESRAAPQSTAISTEEDDQEERSSHPNANRMEQTNLTERTPKTISSESPRRTKSLTRPPEM